MVRCLEVDERDVPRDANVVGSHMIYKVKSEENERKRLKGRLCPHGNHDDLKGKIRSDSATAQWEVIRLLLSLVVILRFFIGCVDIKGAYLQSGSITRLLYVRPPRECGGMRGKLWKLLKLPYGIPEAGRQWAKAIESWMIDTAGFQRVFGVPQLFSRRDSAGDIILLVAKVTDDILMAGTKEAMQQFSEEISSRFTVSKTIIDAPVKFNGCDIAPHADGSIELSMGTYMRGVEYISLTHDRRRQTHERATEDETACYRAMSGALVWIGCAALPQASLTASLMQQKMPRLTVAHLVEANCMLRELQHMPASIRYNRPSGNLHSLQVVTFSDASFNISKSQQYGQTGFISGIQVVTDVFENVYHVIDWSSAKQQRVSHSSYGAEILVCTDADDRGYYVKLALKSLTPGDVRHLIMVDSKALYDTITTLHEGKEYRLRQTVQRLRDSFESREMDVLRWVPGCVNIADALTKRNPFTRRLMSKVCSTGRLSLPTHRSLELDSSEWV